MIKHNLNDIYKSSGASVDYPTFARVIKKFNQAAMEIVCEGKPWPLPLNMGSIELITITRNFSKPRVNWPASLSNKTEMLKEGQDVKGPNNPTGEDWLIYYTDDFYTRIRWNKHKSIDKALKNFRAYRFKPAWTFKRDVSKALRADELTELSL